MGCVGVVSQRGQSMTGSRSVSAFTRSKDRLPVPITRDARNSTVSTPESRRIWPTSWRLRRCGDSFGSASSPRPPRYRVGVVAQATEVNDALHHGLLGGPSKVERRLSVLLLEVLRPRHQVDEVVGRADAFQRSIQRSRVQHVTLDNFGAGLHTGPHLLWAAGQAAQPHPLLFE